MRKFNKTIINDVVQLKLLSDFMILKGCHEKGSYSSKLIPQNGITWDILYFCFVKFLESVAPNVIDFEID